MRAQLVQRYLYFKCSWIFIMMGLVSYAQDPWIILGQETILSPVELGTVILVGDASLTINNVPAPGVQFNGSLWLLGNSTVTMRDSVIRFNSVYHGQYQLAAVENSRVLISGCDYKIPSGVQHGLVAAHQAQIEAYDTDFGFVQFLSAGQSTFRAERLNGQFEVIVQDTSHMNLFDIPRTAGGGELWVWVEFPEDSIATYTPPLPGLTQAWQFPPEDAEGIDQEIYLERCQTKLWPMLVRRNTHLTLKDIPEENWIVVGFYFPGSGSVSNLKNQMTRDYEELALSDRTIILDHASIDTWNLYGQGTSWLRVDDCELGEILAMENSRLIMSNTLIDGTGGFFGANSNAQVVANYCRFTCDVQVSQDAMVEMNYCSLEPYDIDATGEYTFLRIFDRGRFLLNQSLVSTSVTLGGDGVLGVTWLNQKPATPPQAGSSIPLTGTAALFSLNEALANGNWRLMVVPEVVNTVSRGPNRGVPVAKSFRGLGLGKAGDQENHFITELGSGTGNIENDFLGSWEESTEGVSYILKLVLEDTTGNSMVGSWRVPGSAPKTTENNTYQPFHELMIRDKNILNLLKHLSEK